MEIPETYKNVKISIVDDTSNPARGVETSSAGYEEENVSIFLIHKCDEILDNIEMYLENIKISLESLTDEELSELMSKLEEIEKLIGTLSDDYFR